MTTPNLTTASLVGATTFAWYALPDVVRSRAVRGALKVALLAGTTAALVASRPGTDPEHQGPDAADDLIAAVNDAPGRAAAIAAAALTGGTILTVAGEKLIFRHGERRRARGVRAAHTLPALGWGALAALALILEPDTTSGGQ